MLGLLLNPRVILAIALAVFLAGTHWRAYVQGKKTVQAEWSIERAAQVSDALAASEAARAREQALQAAKVQVEVKYAQSKKTAAMAADAARSELVGLRDAIARAASAAPGSQASAAGRTDGAGIGDVLGSCVNEVQDLARNADRLAIKVTGLQGFIAGACQ